MKTSYPKYARYVVVKPSEEALIVHTGLKKALYIIPLNQDGGTIFPFWKSVYKNPDCLCFETEFQLLAWCALYPNIVVIR